MALAEGFLAGAAFLLGVFLAGDLALVGDLVLAAFLAGDAFALLLGAAFVFGEAGGFAGDAALAGEPTFELSDLTGELGAAAGACLALFLFGEAAFFDGCAVFLVGEAFFGDAFLATAAFLAAPAGFLAGAFLVPLFVTAAIV